MALYAQFNTDDEYRKLQVGHCEKCIDYVLLLRATGDVPLELKKVDESTHIFEDYCKECGEKRQYTVKRMEISEDQRIQSAMSAQLRRKIEEMTEQQRIDGRKSMYTRVLRHKLRAEIIGFQRRRK